MNNLLSIILTLVFSTLLLGGYEIYSYANGLSKSLSDIDKKLNLAVVTTDIILGEEFHSVSFNANTLSTEERIRHATRLTRFTNESGLDYVYTMIKKDDIIFFVASSLDLKKFRKGVFEDFYWQKYDDAPKELLEVFSSKGEGYAEYINQWGHFRSFFKHKTTKKGFDYIVAVDVNIADLEKVKRSVLTSALINFVILFAILGLCFYLLNRINKVIYLSDRRKDLALSAGSVGIWEWNIDSGALFLSPSIFQSLNLPNHLVPKSIDDLIKIIHPDDIDIFKSRITDTISSSRESAIEEDFEMRLLLIKNEVAWLSLKGKTLKWKNNGAPSLRAGVIENISKLKQANIKIEKSLQKTKEREEFITLLVNNMPDLISYKDSSGVYQLCNTPFEDVFDRPINSIVGSTDENFFPMHIANLLRENDLQALNSDCEIVVKEWITYQRSDVSKLVETKKIRINPLLSGNPGILSIGRDITEIYTLLTELNKFKRFANYSRQGFLITSLAGDVQYLNAKAFNLFELPDNIYTDAILTDLNVYSEVFIEKLKSKILNNVINGTEWVGEVNLNQSEQVTPTIHTIFIIRNDKGTPIHLGIIVTDISEQKAIEEKLTLETERAEQASKSKSMFLANMSHEIRTPLNAVIGFSQILNEEPSLEVNAKAYVNKIYKAGQRLLNLINDILDLSKMESGKLSLSPTHFNFLQELNEVYSLFTDSAKTRGLSYSHSFDISSDVVVFSDKQKLNQILINLISNAVKYTDSGNVSFEVTHRENDFQLRIIDTGKGMSQSELDTLFTPFQQGVLGENSGGGTGLGLSLTQSLVHMMGGVINIGNRVGGGTECIVTLPLEYSLQANAIEGSSSLVKYKLTSPVRTVVVDDDEDSLNVLTLMLTRIGFEVIAFSNALEAKSYILENKCGIIFTDIRMPEISGMDLLACISKELPQAYCIAVSASSLDHEQQHYIDLGFTSFVSKPVETVELVKVLLTLPTLSLVEIEREPCTSKEAIDDLNPKIDKSTSLCFLNIESALTLGDYDEAERLLSDVSPQFQGSPIISLIREKLKSYSGDEVLKIIAQLRAGA